MFYEKRVNVNIDNPIRRPFLFVDTELALTPLLGAKPFVILYVNANVPGKENREEAIIDRIPQFRAVYSY